LCNRIGSTHLSGLLRFADNPYARKRNARLMPFFHRTNYGKFEPLNSTLLNFNKNTVTCVVFAMMKVAMYSVKASDRLCWRSDLVDIAYNDIELKRTVFKKLMRA
jgi:hypothetical protein